MARNAAKLEERNAIISAGVAARYSKERYTPMGLSKLSNKEISKELTKARSILRKRYERAMKAGVYTSEQAARIERLLTPVKDIPASDRPYQLSAIARELGRESSTVTGARARLRRLAESFRNQGFSAITEENVKEFIDFMDEFTQKEKDALWGSEILYEYYESAKIKQEEDKSAKITMSNFYKWIAENEGRTYADVIKEVEEARNA